RRGRHRRRRPARRGGADAGDRRYPGTSAETDADLLAVGPFLVPAGDTESPFLGEDRVGSPPRWEAALELATWCRASPVDGLRRGVSRRRMAESFRFATQRETQEQSSALDGRSTRALAARPAFA